MATTDNANQHLIVTAFWEVNSGEEGAVAALLKDFLLQAQREPGVKGSRSTRMSPAAGILLL